MARKRNSESGQVVVLAAGAMLLMIGMAALAVDIGFLYATRRNMQTAADAAAIAGVNALQADSTCTASSCPSAQDVAKLNGYTNGVNGVTVTVGPPSTPPNPTSGTYIQVTVAEPVPTFFLRAFGMTTVSVSTSAIAGYVPTPNCVISVCTGDLNNAYVESGNSLVDLPNCNVAIDSSSTQGLVVSGSAALEAASVGVAAASESQAATASSPGAPGVSPAYVANSPVVTDPLSSVAAPTVGACTASTAAKTGTNPNGSGGKGYTSTGGDTISQGTYCGGIIVGGGKTLNLNPGTYILLGGGLQVSGSSSLIGSGVTLYNTVWTAADPAGDDIGNANQYKPISFSGGSSTNLTAETSGPLSGILFFQDPSLPSSDLNQQNTFSGGSSAVLQGDLYFPTTPLVFSGGSSTTPLNVTLIACTINFSGGSTYIGPGFVSATTETTGIKTTKLYE